MNKLQNAMELAQRTANREGKPMAVYNLNQFSPVYVVRDWVDGSAADKGLVARVVPQKANA